MGGAFAPSIIQYVMFQSQEDLEAYVRENYPEVTDSRINDDHFDILCPNCGLVRGFQVISYSFASRPAKYRDYDIELDTPKLVTLRCPTCHACKVWVIYEFTVGESTKDGKLNYVRKIYKVTSIPNDGMQEIDELPYDPPALREAYRQAVRAMDSNAYIAAAAMFRRALQVITRDIIKVTPGNLGTELKQIIGKSYGGVVITNDFKNNAYVIKEAGNQGAHPDVDPDLLDFTEVDAKDLKEIFMELVADLFVVPAAKAQARAEFMRRRKIHNP